MYRNHPVHDFAAVTADGAQLIDVREPDEVAAGSLPGALNIPLGDLGSRLGELDPSIRTVVLCRSGGRSAQAASLLVEAGFADVVNLDGGLLAARG